MVFFHTISMLDQPIGPVAFEYGEGRVTSSLDYPELVSDGGGVGVSSATGGASDASDVPLVVGFPQSPTTATPDTLDDDDQAKTAPFPAITRSPRISIVAARNQPTLAFI